MSDDVRTREFGRELIGTFSGAVLTYLIAVGHETRLFEVAAKQPATSAELAERAGLPSATCASGWAP